MVALGSHRLCGALPELLKHRPSPGPAEVPGKEVCQRAGMPEKRDAELSGLRRIGGADAAGTRRCVEGHWVCSPDWLPEPRGALAKARHPWAEIRKAVGLQDKAVYLSRTFQSSSGQRPSQRSTGGKAAMIGSGEESPHSLRTEAERSLRAPFDQKRRGCVAAKRISALPSMAFRAGTLVRVKWRRGRELNPRIPVLQTSALPLCYLAMLESGGRVAGEGGLSRTCAGGAFAVVGDGLQLLAVVAGDPKGSLRLLAMVGDCLQLLPEGGERR